MEATLRVGSPAVRQTTTRVRGIDRAVARYRVGAMSCFAALAALSDTARTGLLPAILVVSTTTSCMQYRPPAHLPRRVWLRWIALADFATIALCVVAGVSSVAVESLAALNFVGVLGVSAALGTKFRFGEVATAAVVLSAAHISASIGFGVFDHDEVLVVLLINSLAVYAWWRQPIAPQHVRALRVYVHDLHGFLSSLKWSFELHSAEIRTAALEAVAHHQRQHQAMDLLLTTSVPRRPRRRVVVGELLEPWLTDPVPVRWCRVERTALTQAMAAISLVTVDGPPPVVACTVRYTTCTWQVRGYDFVVRNAVSIAAALVDVPHGVDLVDDTLTLTIRHCRPPSPIARGGPGARWDV